MLSDRLQKDLFSKIPSEFTIDGETINFSKRYSSQFTGKNLPAIVLTYIETERPSYIYLNKLHNITDKTTDVYKSEEDKFEYKLNVEGAVDVVKVQGYKDDVFKVFDESRYVLDKNENEIIFQTEDDLPDFGTDFYVKYEHDKIKVELGGEFKDVIQIDVVTTDYKNDDLFINGSRLAKIVTGELKREIQFGINDDSYYNIRDVHDSRNLTSIEGQDYHYRYSFDIDVAYHDIYVKLFDRIEEVNYYLNTEV